MHRRQPSRFICRHFGFSAQGGAPGQKGRTHCRWLHQELSHGRPQSHLRQCPRHTDAQAKTLTPARCVPSPDRCKNLPVLDVILRGDQFPTQHSCRLHGHADALGNDRVRFASQIPDSEDSVVERSSDTWPNRANGKPSARKTRTLHSTLDRRAGLQNVLKYCLAGGQRRRALTAERQRTSSNAARQAEATVIACHHATITAGEDQEWHQIGA